MLNKRKISSPSEAPKSTCFVYDSEFGKLTIASNGSAITMVHFGTTDPRDPFRSDLTDRAFREISEYLAGSRREFDLPLAPEGTPFQKRVWDALRAIPYGETRSYRQIAEQIGNPKACRAVGMANNRNPIAILIPCHRVVGADGSLVGYAGGLEIKKRLLELEKGRGDDAAKTDADAFRKATVTPYLHRANYYETDQMGLIHHSNYIRWMEEARIDFLEQIGWGYRELEEHGLMIPVTAVSCQYKSPVKFGDTVRISVKITNYQGVRLSLEYQITDDKTGRLCAVGSSSHCFCNQNGRPLRLKKFSEPFDLLLSALAQQS